MPRFKYIIATQAGKKREEELVAENIEEAKKQIEKKDDDEIILNIIRIIEKGDSIWDRPHLSFQDKMMFTKHLATMVKVGITITESLEILIGQTTEKHKKLMFQKMLEMIESGQSLSESVRKYDYIFSDVFVNMIATGEKSGTLDKTLEYLDVQLEKEYEIRKKVIGAFIYPVVLISITMMMSLGIVIFIMPKITKIFTSFDVQLPLITRMLIGSSEFMTTKPFTAVGGAVSIILFLIAIFKFKKFKPFWDRVFLRVPVFGRILIYANLARIARTINSLIQTGVPITETLEITRKMLSNSEYKEAIGSAKEKVEQGGQLGASLEDNPKLFPPLATKMLFIGEKTGSLDVTTDRLAQLYEHNVDSLTKNMSTLLEPMLLVLMGTMVGGLALSIILPIYQLPNLLKG